MILAPGAGGDGVDASGVAEHLVLAHQGGAGHLRDHEAGVQPAVPGEEGGEPAGEHRVDELLHPPLADVGQLGDGDGREIEGDGHRLPVEVPAGDEVGALLREEDGGVVGDAVHLALQHRVRPRKRVARGAVDLRHAAQRVRVLHLAAVGVALHDLALGEERAQVAGADLLPGVGAHPHQALVEGAPRSLERLQADGAGDVRRGGEARGVAEGEGAERGHVLGAVDEAQALLGGQLDGREARRGERLAGGHLAAGEARLALADEGERQVRERRQIAGRAHRPLGRDARRHARVEHRQQRVDDLHAHARVPQRDHLRAQHHHPADLGLAQVGPDAARVAAHQVLLQGAHVALLDARLGEGAEAGVDPVHRGPVVARRGDGVDGAARRAHALARLGTERHAAPGARHLFELEEGDRTAQEERLGVHRGAEGSPPRATRAKRIVPGRSRASRTAALRIFRPKSPCSPILAAPTRSLRAERSARA